MQTIRIPLLERFETRDNKWRSIVVNLTDLYDLDVYVRNGLDQNVEIMISYMGSDLQNKYITYLDENNNWVKNSDSPVVVPANKSNDWYLLSSKLRWLKTITAQHIKIVFRCPTTPSAGEVNAYLEAKTDKDIKKVHEDISTTTPLDIPTYDDNPSLTHVDVRYFEGGWNGYKYWMGMTPFPDKTRENPSIVASNDGDTWVEPVGISNPLSTYQDALDEGLKAHSDTDLIMLNNGKLALYYRSYGGSSNDIEKVYRIESSDGVNWDNKQLSINLDGGGVGAQILSPAVEKVGNWFYMWSVNTQGEYYQLERRESSNGLNWAAPIKCTIPVDTMNAWHVDVVYVNKEYHMLVQTRDPDRLYYWKSKDGIKWEGSQIPFGLVSTPNFQSRGKYRSSLAVISTNPLRIDAWVVHVDNSDVYDVTSQHRVFRYRNINLVD